MAPRISGVSQPSQRVHGSAGAGMAHSPQRSRQPHASPCSSPMSRASPAGSTPSCSLPDSPEGGNLAALRQVLRPAVAAPSAALATASASDRRNGTSGLAASDTARRSGFPSSVTQQRRSGCIGGRQDNPSRGGYVGGGGAVASRIARATTDTSASMHVAGPASPAVARDMSGGAGFLDVGNVPVHRLTSAELASRRPASELRRSATAAAATCRRAAGGTPPPIRATSTLSSQNSGAYSGRLPLAERMLGEDDSDTFPNCTTETSSSAEEYPGVGHHPPAWASTSASRFNQQLPGPHVQHRVGRSGGGATLAVDRERPHRNSTAGYIARNPRSPFVDPGAQDSHTGRDPRSPFVDPGAHEQNGHPAGSSPARSTLQNRTAGRHEEAELQLTMAPTSHGRLRARTLTDAFLPPPPLRPASPSGPVSALEQREKDERLGELLQLAAMRGLGDVDPEPASTLLEHVGWDVTEAFTRMCIGGGASAAAAAGTRPAHRRRGGAGGHAVLQNGPLAGRRPVSGGLDDSDGDFWEQEHLRLQQEQYGGEHFMEHHTTHQQRLYRGGVSTPRISAEEAPPIPAWLMAEDFTQDADAGSASEGEATLTNPSHFPPHHRRRIGSRAFARALAEAGGSEALDQLGLGALMDMDNDDEVVGMHALLHALMRTQDEADLQDAMRRSSEEAYSGSFSVPPVDEAVLHRVTKTSQFSSKDAQDQCSVCLMDFEHGDSLRTLECGHRFHMACIDQWLAQSGQCPVCKKQVGSCR